MSFQTRWEKWSTIPPNVRWTVLEAVLMLAVARVIVLAEEAKRVSAANLSLNIETAAVESHRPCIFGEEIGRTSRIECENALLVIPIRPVEQLHVNLESVAKEPVARTHFVGC